MSGADRGERVDTLAVEEPLEIRVDGAPLQVTMRTPGDDIELVHGLLFTQGAIMSRRDVREAYRCSGGTGATTGNALELVMAPGVDVRSTRGVVATTSCGVCGTDSIEEVLRTVRGDLRDNPARCSPTVLTALPDRLRRDQSVFDRTGGIHAAGIFRLDGSAVCIREDVGRHNAVDKVIGHLLLNDALPAADTVLVVSGRASFELVQKAAAAGIPLLVAVSAPSSLAVSLADAVGITLLGFVRGGHANIYTHAHRVHADE